ncbi:SprT family zinc-dependent metalloprotease [Oscillatoria laete-virens NRMC-F 0139]|nr:SprT family zinc-dependent metalloprotease [Oscillatoria laete-virens NRMC-F 0139]
MPDDSHPPPEVSPAPGSKLLRIGELTIPAQFARHPRARRYVMRFRSDGILRVTVPRFGSLREAQSFVMRNAQWVEKAHHKCQSTPPEQTRWVENSEVIFRGHWHRLILHSPAPEQFALRLGQALIPLGNDRPPDNADYRVIVEAWMRQIAREELPLRLEQIAREHGLSYARVTIRSQRGRWGSCSARKTISLNWRLVQTPPEVRDYVLIHELMHLREMNHSSRFWAHVEAACPEYRQARAWLRRNRLLG